jgi:hypothetical protein
MRGIMTEETVLLRIDELNPHPNQEDIYGQEDVDQDFIDSIMQHGVLEALTVTPDKQGYIIVSGHRRRRGAELAGLDAVPVIIRQYKNREEMDIAHLEMNRQRVKTTRQKVNEFLALKQLLRQDLQLIDIKGLSLDEKTADSILVRDRTGADIDDDDEPTRIQELIKKRTGLTQWFQRNATVVYDDIYIGDQLERLRKFGVKEKVISAIWENVKQFRVEVKEGGVSLTEAAKEIKRQIDKQVKKPKQKAEKKKPKKKKSGLFEAIPALPNTWSQKPQKYEIELKHSSIDYILKSKKGRDFGIVKTKSIPVGICVELRDRGNYMIDLDKLAELIEREL